MSSIETLAVDIETYSSVSLKECGVYRYVEAPDFDILLTAYSVNGGPVIVVDHLAGEVLPEAVLAALFDPAVCKTAFNANFERTCLAKWYGRPCPPEQWECSMVLASQCGLPMSLDAVGKALGFADDKAKMTQGKALIRYFCQPCKPTRANGQRTRNMPSDDPDKWELFKAYNAQDVVAEQAIRERLIKWRAPDIEHRFWCLDQRINDAGMRVDIALARNAQNIDARYKDELIEEAKAITGLDNPASVSQVKDWLLEQEGMDVPSLNKKVVTDVVQQLTSEEAKAFMDLRAEFSRSSTKKFAAITRCACADDHVRGCFSFGGAGRTQRFAGRLVQLQNLTKNSMKDLDACRQLVKDGDYETLRFLYGGVTSALSELMRTTFIPEEGHHFIISDFSAIEARVIAWMAGEDWRLRTFEEGGDIYCASASQMFKVPVDKHGANKHLRQKGKVAELACGYGGGVSALKAFGADKMGLSEEDMVRIVDQWRAASPNICALWKSIERCAIRCVVYHAPQRDARSGIRFEWDDGNLFVVLPSGRRMAYWGARYELSADPKKRGKKVLSYMGQDQTTKKFVRLGTWGGKLVENCVQACARDVLRDKMLRLDEEGFDIRAHVHDEVICTEPLGGKTLEQMNAIFSEPLPWAPGLPLKGDGFCAPYYMKD